VVLNGTDNATQALPRIMVSEDAGLRCSSGLRSPCFSRTLV